jgi:hypothetical protein
LSAVGPGLRSLCVRRDGQHDAQRERNMHKGVTHQHPPNEADTAEINSSMEMR